MRFLIKSIYLLLIKIVDTVYQPKLKNNVVILMTFKEEYLNLLPLLLTGSDVTVIYHPKHEQWIKTLHHPKLKVIALSNKNIVKQVIAIKKSRVVLIDTYYLMLGSITKHIQQEVIQLWHASSALKKFGVEDKSVDTKNKKIVEQYLKVYHFTDSYVVAGHKMIDIFKRSLNGYEKNFIKSGLPRLQVFNNDKQHQRNELPKILFIPTYREYTLEDSHKLQETDIENLIIKAHPSDKNYSSNSDLPTKELMLQSDIIITDYSSLAVEAAYYRKKVIFFVPDEEVYHNMRGLNEEYYQLSADRKAQSLHELKELIPSATIPDVTGWTDYQSDNAVNHLYDYIKEKLL